MSDLELEALKRRKMRELQRRMTQKELPSPPPQPQLADLWSIVKGRLVGRGMEVMEAAYSQYPKATKLIVKQLSDLIREGKLEEELTGELLFNLFRILGLNVKLQTRIVFQEHGKLKSIAEKMKSS